MFIGVLMVAASGAFADAFADEVSSFNQNAAFSTPTSFSGAGSSFLIPSVSSSSASGNASGSTSSSSSSSSSSSGTPPSTGGARSFLSGVAGKAGDVVVGALNLIGVRYRWGGSSPDSGLDCSGFVRYVFQDTLGMALPRRAEEMSRVGEKVRVADLKPGDLVFFNTMRRTFSHVGIYIGDNKFVHSPSTGSTIRVDDMDDAYWEKRFTGARRVETSFSPDQQQDLRQRVSATIGGGN
ncbi:C40 family peptidase [Paraburkholderia sp. 2C]|jgi:cell wall-associated NlpC family hydrolase